MRRRLFFFHSFFLGGGKQIICHDLFDFDLGNGNSSYDFYGVYDGHGGSAVSRRCAREMYQYFLRELSKSSQFSAEYLDEEEIDWAEREADGETEHFRYDTSTSCLSMTGNRAFRVWMKDE